MGNCGMMDAADFNLVVPSALLIPCLALAVHRRVFAEPQITIANVKIAKTSGQMKGSQIWRQERMGVADPNLGVPRALLIPGTAHAAHSGVGAEQQMTTASTKETGHSWRSGVDFDNIDE